MEFDDECGELREGAELSSSKARALRILGSRSLSAREIEKRLLNKEIPEQTARLTVEWLEDIGAINDAEYADSIVRHYFSKGHGIARIKDELHKRGIDREMWEEAIEGAGDPEDAAYDYITKKLKGSCGKDESRRVTDALCRRGFSYGEVRAAMNRYTESLEETEGAGP